MVGPSTEGPSASLVEEVYIWRWLAVKNIRLQLDEDAANLLKAVSRLRGQTMGEIVHLLVMDACGGQSPEVVRLKSQLAGMYEAVTAPYLEGE